ncbi:MAG: DEAD/DEAH box helicase [Nitrospirae bacterium]|nr:DEAD/DEAH box helicase [Nitrospirota bacterium]
MSDSTKAELLGLLQAFSPGDIYSVAPKQYVVRGFDYYRQGKLLEVEWTPDQSAIIATVKGTKTYQVALKASGSHLSFGCGCPAWSFHSNCKHVICSLLTIKNLLDPTAFKIINRDEFRRQGLLRELFDDQLPADDTVMNNDKTEEPAPKVRGYSLIINKGKQINEIYIRLDDRRLRQYHHTCPHELRQFVHPLPSYLYRGRLLDFEQFLRRYGNKHSIILKTESGETGIQFEDVKQYRTCTLFDAYPEHVEISKLSMHEDREIGATGISGDYIFDLDAGTFSLINDRRGWQFWNEANDILHTSDAYEGAPDYDNTSFPLPVGMFRMSQLIFSSSEGDVPLGLILKTEGRPAKVLKSVPSYRMMISQVPEADLFTLRAECIIESMPASPTFKLFRMLTSTRSGFSSKLRIHKRRKVLCQAFFDMLMEEAKTGADSVIKKALANGDFRRYRIKREAREVLKAHLAIFSHDERQLLLQNNRWLSVDLNKKRELSLYRIAYEIFGWEIFKDMQQHDLMIVSAEEMSRNLPLLYERLKEQEIELYYEQKPVKTTSWDFAFDAARPSNLDWFEIRPEIRCDGKLIDEKTWQKILAGRGMSEQDGCIRILDANSQRVLSMISDFCKTDGKKKGGRREVVQVPRLRILDWIMLRNNGVRIRLPQEDEEIINRLTTFDKIDARPLPSGLKAKLRAYQKTGYTWLAFLYENRFGACLADDMGLGKTVQAISLLGGIREGRISCRGRDEQYPHLVVLPPSLLFNWENEISRFYPGLKIVFYTGKERNTSFEGFDVVLTTYGLVRRDIEKLKEIKFDVIIFDEAQAIKNIYADVTGAVRQLKGNFKLAMTGTPVENHIGEYFSIVDLAVPGLLGEYEEFRPLIRQEVSPSLNRIIMRTRPFVLRRTKEKILKELPPKTETDIYLDLTEKQKALYKRTVAQVRQTIDEAYRTKTGQQAQIIALTAILKLRQLCVSPQLLSPEIKEPSPKIVFLIESLRELVEENHSALVFSQFTSFLDVLEQDLVKHKIDFLRLDGSTQVKKRKKLIESFQNGDGPSVFLLSLKAGGQGLNLTRASYVFHLDPWWNPAVENQASDRAHRIGQKKNVTITRILMRHTIEEKMMALKKKKLELYKAVMDESGSGKKGFFVTRADFNFLLG